MVSTTIARNRTRLDYFFMKLLRFRNSLERLDTVKFRRLAKCPQRNDNNDIKCYEFLPFV